MAQQQQQYRENNMHESRAKKMKRYSHVVTPEQSIVLTQWVEPDRPFSQKELRVECDRFFQHLGLDEIFVEHEYYN